jgi:hypothetical protein
MRILFDQGTPHPLRRHLHSHAIETCAELGWSALRNGELLRCAEEAGYEVLITTDQNLRYQQNLSGRKLAVVVLLSTSWPKLQRLLPVIQQAVDAVQPSGYVEIAV